MSGELRPLIAFFWLGVVFPTILRLTKYDRTRGPSQLIDANTAVDAVAFHWQGGLQ